jgi:hypothetical protein
MYITQAGLRDKAQLQSSAYVTMPGFATLSPTYS